jgi:DNA-binding transcriptional LysR family regulator
VARAIAPLAEQIDQLAHELGETARAASDAPSGPVRIAVSPVLAEHFLIPRVPELMQRFPGIELDVRADIARTSFVGEREADIALRTLTQGKAPAEASAVAAKVGTLGFAAFASPAYVARHGAPERPLTSLAGHSVISTRGWFANTWNDQLETPGTYVLSAYPFATVLAAVAAGLGIALLPCLGADRDARLVRVSDVVMSFDLWVVTSAQARNNPRIRSVKDAIVELLREHADEVAGFQLASLSTSTL